MKTGEQLRSADSITLRPVQKRDIVGNPRAAGNNERLRSLKGAFTFSELGSIVRAIGLEDKNLPSRMLPASLLSQVRKEYARTGDAKIGLETLYSALRLYQECAQLENVAVEADANGIYEWLELPELPWSNTAALRSLGYASPITPDQSEKNPVPIFVRLEHKNQRAVSMHSALGSTQNRYRNQRELTKYILKNLAFKVHDMKRLGFMSHLAWEQFVATLFQNDLRGALGKLGNVESERGYDPQAMAHFLEIILDTLENKIIVLPGSSLSARKHYNPRDRALSNTMEVTFPREKIRVYDSLSVFLAQKSLEANSESNVPASLQKP
jgi:hypothetical protein